MKLSDFYFDLPPHSIASSPANPKDSARLLAVSPQCTDYIVSQLPELLCAGDLLVVNNTKVIPAKLTGKRGTASVTVTLHKELRPAIWKAFAKPAKKLQLADKFTIADDFSAEVIEKGEEGEVTLRFNCEVTEFYSYLARYGSMPLPPYIKRNNNAQANDAHDYQTIYAEHKGAVAAPTAGLHFTDSLIQSLQHKGIEIAQVTLHVGAGTFLPVKVENISEHKMHAEYGEITQATADKINQVRKRGGRIVAVGTTSLRLLETATDDVGITHSFVGDTSIFITPGYRFKAVDMLMTNFHLPCSTLFMLVCAFAGSERMKQAYRYAIEKGYRFYSYGDASLLTRA
jgi:S-adenosylmethionine:tRNA ribosyltransferase-isomerase